MIEEIVETRRFEFLDLYEAQNESSRRLLRAIAVAGPVAESLAEDYPEKIGIRAWEWRWLRSGLGMCYNFTVTAITVMAITVLCDEVLRPKG